MGLSLHFSIRSNSQSIAFSVFVLSLFHHRIQDGRVKLDDISDNDDDVETVVDLTADFPCRLNEVTHVFLPVVMVSFSKPCEHFNKKNSLLVAFEVLDDDDVVAFIPLI